MIVLSKQFILYIQYIYVILCSIIVNLLNAESN